MKFRKTNCIHQAALMLCLSLFCLLALASSKNLRYVNITQFDVYEGLVGNKVTQIGQDADGFMWFGTHGGLSRFDSQKFHNFKQDTLSANSLPANQISLFHLSQQEMWISLNDIGLARFDLEKRQFSMVPVAEGENTGIEHSVVFGIASDDDLNVWIFQFDHGISVFEKGSQTFTHYTPENTNWLSNVRFFDAKKDQQGYLWVATLAGTIFKIDPKTRKAESYAIDFDPQDQRTARMYAITVSPDNQIYASGYQGVYRFNPQSANFEQLVSDQDIIDLMGDRHTVRSLLADSQGHLWLATRGALFLLKNNQLTQIRFVQKGKPVLANLNVRSVFEDREGNIWLATDENGVIKLNYGWDDFDIYLPFQDPEKTDNRIHTVLSDHGNFDDTLWINNEMSQNILVYRYQKGQLIQSKIYGVSHQLPEVVLAIYQDSDYRFWATSINGLHVFDQASNQFMHITSSELNGGVTGLIETTDKLYFGVYGERSIYSVDKATLEIAKHQDKLNDILLGSEMDNEGQVWLVGNRGLEIFDKDTRQFSTLIESDEGFNSIWLDQEKSEVWLISNGKVLKYSNVDGNLVVQDTSQINSQVSSEFVDSIQLFNEQLWLGSNNGVIVVDPKSNQVIETLRVDDNLPSNEIIRILQMYDGSIMIFTDAGIVHLNRSIDHQPKIAPTIQLTEMSLNDAVIPAVQTLDYNYGSVTFAYQLMSYAKPNLHQYQYKLQPESAWISAGGQNHLTFHQLVPGAYQFQVRGGNQGQPWSEPVIVEFIVLPPPWKSNLAYLLYVLSGLLLLGLLIYLYKKRWQYNATIEQAKEKQAFAETQLSLTTSLVSSLEIDELLAKIKKQIKDKVGADQVEVCYWNSQNHYQIFSDNSLDKLEKNELGSRAIGMYENNEKHLIESLNQGSRLWVLFSHSEEKLGLIQLFREKGGFKPKDISLARAYATQSSLALENARLFEEVNDLAEQANASNKAKSDFLAQVSHEVRTPMNGILGMNELLLDTELNEEQRLYASAVAESGEHLLHIINDILDLSKIEAGELVLENRPVNLHLLADEVVKSFVSVSKNKKILFWLDFSPQLAPHRMADSVRLKQIMMNLLSNAFKFTSKGEVSLMIQPNQAGDAVVITVNDSGIGIDEALLDKLFEPFSQADSSITRKYGGTGLGLSIVKQLVEKMDGFLEIISEPGMGTTVNCCIPLEQAEKQRIVLRGQKVQVHSHHRLLKKAFENGLAINGIQKTENFDDCDVIFILDDENQDHSEIIANANRELKKVYLIKPVYQHQSYQAGTYGVIDVPCSLQKLEQLFTSEVTEPVTQTKVSRSGGLLHVLVVEDNPINQQLLIELLEKEGHWVDVFDDANHALAGIKRSNYDLLLVDYHLPDLTGIEFITLCRQAGIETRAIIMTADVSRELKNTCELQGIEDIITKPFKMAELMETICLT
ncbi:MAG: ATP-binding protein [Marinicella sp.]